VVINLCVKAIDFVSFYEFSKRRSNRNTIVSMYSEVSEMRITICSFEQLEQ